MRRAAFTMAVGTAAVTAVWLVGSGLVGSGLVGPGPADAPAGSGRPRHDLAVAAGELRFGPDGSGTGGVTLTNPGRLDPDGDLTVDIAVPGATGVTLDGRVCARPTATGGFRCVVPNAALPRGTATTRLPVQVRVATRSADAGSTGITATAPDAGTGDAPRSATDPSAARYTVTVSGTSDADRTNDSATAPATGP